MNNGYIRFPHRYMFLLSLLFFLFEKSFAQSKGSHQTVGTDSVLAMELLKEAETLRMKGLYGNALIKYEEAKGLFKKINLISKYVKCLSKEGYCYTMEGQAEKGEPLLKEAYEVSQEILGKDHQETIGVIYDLSQHYRRTNSLDLALEYLETAFALWSKSADTELHDLAMTQAQIGMIYFIKYDFDNALIHFKEGIEIAKQEPESNRGLIGNIYNQIGMIQGRYGDFDKAIDIYLEALDILDPKEPSYHFSAATLHANISFACLKTGDTKKALLHAKKHLAAYLEHYEEGSPFTGKAYKSLGDVYLRMENFDEALRMYQKAIELLSKFHTAKFEYHSRSIHTNLGIIHEARGNYDLALKEYKEAILLKEKVGGKDDPSIINTLSNLGSLLLKMNQYQEAQAVLNKAAVLSKKYNGELNHTTAIVYMNDSMVKLGMGNFYEALSAADKSINGFLGGEITENDPLLVPHVDVFSAISAKGTALMSIYKQCTGSPDDLIAALDSYKHGMELINKKLGLYEGQDSKITIMGFAIPIIEGGVNVSWELFRLTDEVKYKETAYWFCEKSKAIALREANNILLVNSLIEIPEEELKSIKQIYNKLVYFKEALINEERKEEDADPEKIKLFIEKSYHYQNEYDSLILKKELKYPSFKNLKSNKSITSIQKLQKEFADNETLIEYFLGDTTLYTFTIDRSGLKVHQQKIDSSFFRAIDRMRQFSTQPGNEKSWREDYQQFVADSRYLHDILLPPAAKNNQLIIIPDGILNFLPFNLLLTEDPDENTIANSDYRSLPYLIRDHDIRYEYSATLMVESKHTKPRSLWQRLNKKRLPYCGFAPSYGNGDPIASRGETDSVKLAELYPGLLRGELAPLTHNRSEVETASRTLDGLPFTGNAATEKAFKQNAPQAGILHLAMHALTNDIEPLFSQLAFEKTPEDTSEDSRLHAYEMYNMHLKADLAVLSACNTGAGKLQRGEGVMSLSRAFKYAGVPNVVMSLWTASDEPTKTIISTFFLNLKAGMGKDQALCAAQRNFYQNTAKQEYTHPYYWSTMMLIGDGNPLFYNSILWPYYLIALLAVALALFVWRRNTRQFGQNKISH